MYPKVVWCIASLLLTQVLFPRGAFSNNHYASNQDEIETAGDIEQPPPIKTRLRRALNTDDCHNLANSDLPRAHTAIVEAWTDSMTAFLNITSAINHIKSCVGWNLFVTIPCTIKGAMEFWNSYKTYQPQFASFVKEVKNSSLTVVESFYGCAKILILHRAS